MVQLENKSEGHTNTESLSAEYQNPPKARITDENREVHFAKGVSYVSRRSQGLYVEGYVGDIPVAFTVDTGATISVVSQNIYNKMSMQEKPALNRSVSLMGANGLPITELGTGLFKLRIGPITLEREAVVADIKDDALIGYDVLGDESVDILFSRNVMVLNGFEIPGMKCESAKRVNVIEKAAKPCGQNTVSDEACILNKDSSEQSAGCTAIESRDTQRRVKMTEATKMRHTSGGCCSGRPLRGTKACSHIWRDYECKQSVRGETSGNHNDAVKSSVRDTLEVAARRANEAIDDVVMTEPPDHPLLLYERSASENVEPLGQPVGDPVKRTFRFRCSREPYRELQLHSRTEQI